MSYSPRSPAPLAGEDAWLRMPADRVVVTGRAAELDRRDPEGTSRSFGNFADVRGVGGDHAVASTDRTLGHGDIDDVAVAGWLTRIPTLLASSSVIGSMSHIRSTRASPACRAPPRHAWARTGAGTTGTTSSAIRPACSSHILRLLRSAATSAPVSYVTPPIAIRPNFARRCSECHLHHGCHAQAEPGHGPDPKPALRASEGRSPAPTQRWPTSRLKLQTVRCGLRQPGAEGGPSAGGSVEPSQRRGAAILSASPAVPCSDGSTAGRTVLLPRPVACTSQSPNPWVMPADSGPTPLPKIIGSTDNSAFLCSKFLDGMATACANRL